MLCGRLNGRGVWRRIDTYTCMTKFLHCSSETITILFLYWLYPNKNKKFKYIYISGPVYNKKSINGSNIYIFTSKHSALHKIRIHKYLWK